MMFSGDAVTLPEFTMTDIPLSKLQQLLVGSFHLFARTARQTVMTDTQTIDTHTDRRRRKQYPPRSALLGC